MEARAPVADERELTPYLASVWEKTCEIFTLFTPDYHAAFRPSVKVETWLDSGRLIYVLRRKRELARLLLNVPVLKQRYFALPKEQSSFTPAYDEILATVLRCLTDSLDDPEVREILALPSLNHLRIVATDSDDRETEKVLLGA